MAYRKFVDSAGRAWEVRDRSSAEWEFTPLPGNPEPPRRVAAPGHESDPFELSAEEMQRLFDSADPGRGRRRASPFGD